MDAAVGDTTTYEYEKIPNRAALAATDMNDWILVMQGSGAGRRPARPRAVEADGLGSLACGRAVEGNTRQP